MIISAGKMALGGRTEIQDGGSQHVVDVGTGTGELDGSLLVSTWRIVAAILASVSCPKIYFGFPWSMSPGITSCVDFCRGGSGPLCENFYELCFYFLDV